MASQSDTRQELRVGGTVANVTSVFIHPQYDHLPYGRDIGIIKLSDPISEGDGIGYAVLASKGSDPDVGTMITVAGWSVMTHS